MMNLSRNERLRSSSRSRARIRPAAMWVAAVLLCVPVASAAADGATETNSDAALRAEYGVTLALGGKTDEAKRAFVSVLSEDPGHAGALNNLGNLELVDGDPAMALAFYRRAAVLDSTDAGIVLNRSVALLLLGDEAGARGEAARGLRLAGGIESARALLALPGGATSEDQAKAAEPALLTQEEIQALLSAAAVSVPADSLGSAIADSTGSDAEEPAEEPAEEMTWRSAGLRASDAFELSTMIYWKR